VLTCDPANQAALVDLLHQNTDAVIVTLDGWRSTSFVAAQDGTRVVIISQWRDPAVDWRNARGREHASLFS
jgi:hypothetical protein